MKASSFTFVAEHIKQSNTNLLCPAKYMYLIKKYFLSEAIYLFITIIDKPAEFLLW